MPKDFLDSPKGLKIQQSLRRSRRICLDIEGIEPRAKHSMREADKDKVQEQVLREMERSGRRAFRGPIALRLLMQTSERNPAHSANIAKNLLDLFAKPRPALRSHRAGLLYADDRQVQALSVTCHHGEAKPMISVTAMPMRDLIADLKIIHDTPLHCDDPVLDNHDLHLDVERRDDLSRHESFWRGKLGAARYDYLFRFYRARVQEHLLARAALTPNTLAVMSDAGGLGPEIAEMWHDIFAQSPLHICLCELPTTTGSSEAYKQEVESKLRAFQKRMGSLLVPVALEVAVRPPPLSREALTHDLDNVVRSYLLPRVIEILKPVSHFAFTLDDDARKSLALFTRDGDKRFPPLTTSVGVTRFDIWRLPPAHEGSEGYVQMALVNDWTGYGDPFSQIDAQIDRWIDSLD